MWEGHRAQMNDSWLSKKCNEFTSLAGCSDSTTNIGSHIEWKGGEPYDMKNNHV